MLVACLRQLCQTPQAAHAVMFAIDRMRGQQIPLLGDHEEKQAVDQAQELLVEPGRLEFAVVGGLTQVSVVRMTEQAVGELLYGLLDPIAEPLADTATLLDGLGVPALQKARLGFLIGMRQAGAMEQPVEEREVGKMIALEQGPEVELDVSLPAQ